MQIFVLQLESFKKFHFVFTEDDDIYLAPEEREAVPPAEPPGRPAEAPAASAAATTVP